MAVVAVDGVGTIKSANRTAKAFFGRELAAGEPVNIVALIPCINVAELASDKGLERFNAKCRHGGDCLHRKAIRVNGAEAFVDVQAARFSVKGEAFLTLFIQDVTAVVAAEAAVQDLRLQITYNWRLNSLGEMASMVAHELNQPLSAILNFLDAAKTVVGRPEIDRTNALKFIRSAEAQAERASEVIRRLRALMSRDTGFHTDSSLSQVVGEIMPILNINARELDADITVNIPDEDHVVCDRVQVQQLVMNLVRNSLDAPETGERRRILISGEQTGTGYSVRVEDNGPGVPEAVAPKLFDPLTSTKLGGMGLGLSICRTIVEAHHGTITYGPSALGGAGFLFTLNDRSPDA
tara:strand:+ start:1505 stop:2557 length:1053 start_codon:yes stop_codon:yes gene_type:complete